MVLPKEVRIADGAPGSRARERNGAGAVLLAQHLGEGGDTASGSAGAEDADNGAGSSISIPGCTARWRVPLDAEVIGVDTTELAVLSDQKR